MSFVPLAPPVPYISQRGNTPRNDCGPACCLMLARWLGRAQNATVEQWASKYDPEDDGTTAAQLMQILRNEARLTPVHEVDTYPRIELVQYNKLPPANRSDRSGRTFWHWIVRLSDTTYHDPYHFGRAGANLSANRNVLDAARIGSGHRVGVVERPSDEQTDERMSETRTNDDWLRLRSTPSTAMQSNHIAWIEPKANIQVVGRGRDEQGRVWLRAAFDVKHLRSASSQSKPHTVEGWCAEWLTRPISSPAPPPAPPPPSVAASSSRLLGWNVLGNHQWAQFAYDRGCRSFVWLEGLLGAHEFKLRNPDATVIYRRWIEHGVKFGNGRELAEYVGVGTYPGLIYMGYNEADQWGQDGDDLHKRLTQDVEAARIARDKGCFYIAGTFSMGTPDFTNADTVRIIREVAAPAYNSGLMGFDMHLYSPNMDHIFDPAKPIWYERRWEFLFKDLIGKGSCGFDPRVRNIYATEIGLDEAGVGGFPAHNVSDEWLARWCDAWLSVTRAPLVIGGVAYPSPVQAGALFQAGDSGRWAGYRVEQYTPVFEQRWRGN